MVRYEDLKAGDRVIVQVAFHLRADGRATRIGTVVRPREYGGWVSVEVDGEIHLYKPSELAFL